MPLRTVIEEDRFTTDIDSFRRRYEGIDELHATVTYILAEYPRMGTPLRIAPDFYVYETLPVANTPAFWILYTFDDLHVYFHSIQQTGQLSW